MIGRNATQRHQPQEEQKAVYGRSSIANQGKDVLIDGPVACLVKKKNKFACPPVTSVPRKCGSTRPRTGFPEAS